MRIIHIEDYYQPQLGYQETFLAREHVRMGHDVHMITSDRHFPFPDYDATSAPVLGKRLVGAGVRREEDGITVHRLATGFEAFSRVWLRGLVREIESVRPDVVFAHGMESITSFRVAAWKMNARPRCRLIYDCHTLKIQARSRLSPLFRLTYRELLKHLILRAGDGFVAVSDATREYMESAYRFPRARITVIPQGADTSVFKADDRRRARARQELGIALDEVVFIYVGKVIPDKGVHFLVEALQQLVRECPDKGVRILVVGGGPAEYRAQMVLALRKANLEGAFVWAGLVPNAELPRYYSAADIGVWPCEVTITQLEAMACALPIIVGNSPAAIERVSWSNGLTHKEGDAGDLCRVMSLLLADEPLRLEMGRRGRAAAESAFSWRSIAARFIALADDRSDPALAGHA